ncbi:hypothetical protein [Deinococcus alpinitundrae]|uniref:hypothetical protein n=1 Tax=Deinococcus alpinitundrae TaxID=468913 RepID=UPI001379B170|nr:hypothetical protein [Deinococcus alpinitundrae]
MKFLTYYVTFSRAGAAWPYARAHQRAAGEYKPGELAALGGNLEILPGNLCGSGNLKLSAVPERGGSRMAPGDWVRVLLSDSDVPIYLGEVGQEPWEEGGGEVKLLSLKDRVSDAAWRSDVAADGTTVLPLKDRFKPYLQAVLARAVLPPGITVGSIADVNAVLNALTLFETVGDAMQAALPAAAGATWGVNALGEIVVHQLSDTLTHRFPRTRSDRPPGTRDGYKNCVRFEYARPDGVRAFFEYKAKLEIAVFGEAWLPESLPASVTTTQNNPYSGTSVDINIPVVHPDEPTFNLNLHTTNTALTPNWTGHLGDGLGIGPGLLEVKSGPNVVLGGGLTEVVQITKTATEVSSGGTVYTIPSVVPSGGGTRFSVRIEYRTDGGTWTLAITDFQSTSATFPINGTTTEVRYNPGDVAQYYQYGGPTLHGFDVNITNPVASLKVYMPAASTATSTGGLRAAGQILAKPVQGLDGGVNGITYSFVVRNLSAPTTIRVALPGVFKWLAGDLVTTDEQVSGVILQDAATGAEVNITLARKDDIDGPDLAHPEIGRRRTWATPVDVVATTIVVMGDPNQCALIGAAIADQGALVAYAYGLLRYKMQPVRSWVGKYKTLRRLEVSGLARFDTANGDVDLDVTRGVYDLDTLTVSIEAGTPQPLDDTEALDLGFQSVERILRTPGGGT